MGRLSDDTLTLSFVKGGNARTYTLSGWSEPEALETWSIGRRSILELPVRSPEASQILMLAVRPHVNAKGLARQRLNLTVNGVHLASFTLEGRTTRACVIPPEVVGKQEKIQLVFETPDAVAPSSFGDSMDGRVLAVAFTRLSLWPEGALAAAMPLTPSAGNATGLTGAATATAERLPLSKLMLQFESLGENCEFGLVQRNFNAEPLGIFRFSSTPLPQLLQALESRLDGLGEPGSVAVDISSNGNEFMIKDRRFGFLYHAWVRTGEQTAEAVEERELKRLPFLKRKLLEDLAVSEKIFIFHAMRRIPEEEVFPLAALLRWYGANTLLFVTLADESHEQGTVEVRAPGFMVGYLDRFAAPDNAADASYAVWASICMQAHALHRATNARTD